ncbi:nucleotide-sugar transporter-domain-containing protein [Haematococcus lacustris]
MAANRYVTDPRLHRRVSTEKPPQHLSIGMSDGLQVPGTPQVAHAYALAPPEKKIASQSLKILLVTMDCLFLGLQPVLVHLSKNSEGQYSFTPLAINFLTELAKTTFALITLLALGTGRPGVPMYRSLRSFLVDAHHNRLLAVPALLYAVNNSLKFSMQLFFKPTTTKMLGNLKIFTIALLMRFILKRHFNLVQWEALFLLVAGITVNQLSRSCPLPGAPEELLPPLLPAVLCTLGSVTVPSAASVYNEFALKQHMDTSVHLQNFFLYFFGMVFNLGAVLAVGLFREDGVVGMFQGQSRVTLGLIINNAAQGILASFFYKFADTILKKYSSTIATIFTAIMSFLLFSHPITVNFGLGVAIVFISMHQFFTFGEKKQPKSSSLAATAAAGGERAPKAGRLIYSPSLEHISLAPHTTPVGHTHLPPGKLFQEEGEADLLPTSPTINYSIRETRSLRSGSAGGGGGAGLGGSLGAKGASGLSSWAMGGVPEYQQQQQQQQQQQGGRMSASGGLSGGAGQATDPVRRSLLPR